MGPILAEVLRGFRRTQQADWVASRLRSAHYLETTWEDWRNAAALGREVAANGYDSSADGLGCGSSGQP